MTNKMWGGRFGEGPSAIMAEINASIDFDRRLYAQDIAGSKAHAAMLAKQGIISKSDAAAIGKGLDNVKAEMVDIRSGESISSTAYVSLCVPACHATAYS